MKTKEYSLEVGGKTLKAMFSDLADQASGSVIISYGNTSILVTAVMGKKQKEADFFPLTVDFEERFYAAGKILGSRFIRREGRPTDDAILAGRAVDRTIRPLFDQSLRHEIQVVLTVLSLDKEDPDVLGVIGASLALGTSDIPWNGPVGAVRIGRKEEKMIVNPNYEERAHENFSMDMMICGKDNNINMIEVAGNEVSEEIAIESMKLATEEIEKIQKWQEEIIKEIGKEKKTIEKAKAPEGIAELFQNTVGPKLYDAVFSGPGKANIYALEEEFIKSYKEKFPEEKETFAKHFYEEKINELIHKEAVLKGNRPDGRKTDELRPLFARAGGISPILHGSGIFYRGGTHVLSVLTLGGPGDSQEIDGMETKGKKRFMHHYNFPPYSVGEPGRMGGLNRRMTGHGALAEKALIPVIPAQENFPYTIRIVSESLASNGSTSMGSVCGATLAFMDAGVPITRPVAGIASGLMLSENFSEDGKYCLLTDIQGPEDHHGDMDFKVAGTKEGITAIQMDVKVDGIPLKILGEALGYAKKARLEIIDVILKEISAPRPNLSPNAPEILSHKVKVDQIGLIIGTGGKTIKDIMEKTGAQIDIEDDGTVYFTGKDGSAGRARDIVVGMTKEYKVGEKFEGPVTRIMDFGAFVKIGHNTEGLVHVSEIAPFRVDKVGTYLKEGQIVPVIIKEIDEKGRNNLSIKLANPNFFEKQ